MTLPLVEGETQSTGLSRSQILAGDPRVALLVLAAIIDYNLHESEDTVRTSNTCTECLRCSGRPATPSAVRLTDRNRCRCTTN